MCIIAAKPVGVKMPDEDTISRMWYRNSDGAGIMYAVDGKVRIDKGFMKLADFKAHLEKIAKNVDLTNTAVVMHFRITTHGGTCPENCHPFPITRSIKMLKKLHQSAPIGIAHNGIIPNTPRKGISDTMEYIATQLAPLYDLNRKFYKNKCAMELVENAIQSKMAILTGEGEIYLVGDFTEDNGIKYSNTTYKPYEYTTKYYSGAYGSWTSWDNWDKLPVVDDDETATETEYDYTEIPLMWAGYMPEGSYFKIDNKSEMLDDLEDLLIDEDGRTYMYDWDYGAAFPCVDVHIFDANGFPAKYDPDLADLEIVGETYDDYNSTPTG